MSLRPLPSPSLLPVGPEMDEAHLLGALVEGDDVEELERLARELPSRLVPACWRRIGTIAGARGDLFARASAHSDPRVGRAFLEGVGVAGARADVVRQALESPHWLVVEEACFLAGELGDRDLVPRLVELALGHEEPLVKEAALGALGALGDDRAIPAIVSALASTNVYLRRRAVVVAWAFEDPGLAEALAAAHGDRDPQVRAILADLEAGTSDPEGA